MHVAMSFKMWYDAPKWLLAKAVWHAHTQLQQQHQQQQQQEEEEEEEGEEEEEVLEVNEVDVVDDVGVDCRVDCRSTLYVT